MSKEPFEETQLREALDFAVDAARQAGRFTLRYFQRDPAVHIKEDNTPVTEADRGAEALLRELIQRRFPDHGILGEEFGEQPGRVPARWILDPVDGTFSFICGVPLYSTLIGLEWHGRMVVGIICLPAIDLLLAAAEGLGCRANGRLTRVSGITELSQARISTTSTALLARQGREQAYQRLRQACATDRGWPDAYAYALLASGQVEVVLDSIMSIWDTAALFPIVREAGGTLTDWQGRHTHSAPEALATNGVLLEAVLSKLEG